MSYFTDALKEAVEKGGYNGSFTSAQGYCMDARFWQALSAARGWGKQMTDKKGFCKHCGIHKDHQPSRASGCNHVHYPEACNVCSVKARDWRVRWHEFIDCLINEQSVENFFMRL